MFFQKPWLVGALVGVSLAAAACDGGSTAGEPTATASPARTARATMTPRTTAAPSVTSAATPPPPTPATPARAVATVAPTSDLVITVDEGPATTGNAAVDAMIAVIEDEDVDALLAAWVPGPVPCGIPAPYPACPAGTPPNTYVDAYLPPGECAEREYTLERAALRAPLERLLSASSRSSLYAVTRAVQMSRPPPTSVPMRPRPEFVVMTTGDAPSPLATPLTWYVTGDGRITSADRFCGEGLGASYAGWLLSRFAGESYVVAPRATCASGPAEVFLPSARPTAFGGDQLIVSDPPGQAMPVSLIMGGEYFRELSRAPQPRMTEFGGGLTRLEDVRSGRALRVTGFRLDICVLEAWTVEPG